MLRWRMHWTPCWNVLKNLFEMISLQEALGNLVVAYAERLLSEKTSSTVTLHELAIARAMDTALSSMFCRLGLAINAPAVAAPLAAVRQFEEALAVFDGDNSRLAAGLGTAFEQIRGTTLSMEEGQMVVATSPERRGKGIYFTPIVLAEAMVQQALLSVLTSVASVEDLRQVRIIDPAAGCGAFLLAAVRIGARMLAPRAGFRHLSESQIRAEIASHCIYGVDIDPLSIATTRSLLQAEVGLADWSADTLQGHFHVADAVSAPTADWHAWFPQVFPDGFSLVITNPPWSKLRPLRHEFFEHMDAQVRLYQGTELGRYLDAHLTELVSGAWTEYAARTQALSRTLRESPDYVLNRDGAGDTDLYKYFAERSLALLSDNGIAALLLPSGVLRAQGSAGVRALLRSSGTITQLTEYINRKRLFDIHSMYRFCSILFAKGDSVGIRQARFAQTDVDIEVADELALGLDFLQLVGGSNLLIPEVRTVHERDILTHIYERYPIAGADDSGWEFAFRRELDMTNDAEAFVAQDQARADHYQPQPDGRWLSPTSSVALLPLYEGRMVHQFDHAAKIYLSGQGRSAVWKVPLITERAVSPHYLVPEDYLRAHGWTPRVRVGYCEISGHANERTILATLLPANCVCGNKVPVLRLLNETSPQQQMLWLALANSLVVDWVMRRFVSTTINHFYWQNMPLPTPGTHAAHEAVLITAAQQLSLPPQTTDSEQWLGQRSLLRAVIDATVLRMYGLNRADLAVMLDDFPKLKIAHRRGSSQGISMAQLIDQADQAIENGQLDLARLEASLGCPARMAASTYTPRDQVKYL